MPTSTEKSASSVQEITAWAAVYFVLLLLIARSAMEANKWFRGIIS